MENRNCNIAIDRAPGSVGGELDEYLAAWERSSSWRVERVLKESDFEVTEVVFFVGAHGGELGPFVRKQIDCSAGVGSAYERVFELQRSGLASPYLPKIIECQRMGERLSVVMEWVEGPSLEAFVENRGPGAVCAAAIIPGICDAVSCLHERFAPPLIHRDLKPSNIIVRDGMPVVIDFGISRTWSAGAEADTVHFGTRAYAPPEQFGFGQTDERSDVYALGGLLFYCLTGCDPISSASLSDIESRGVSHELAAVVARARSLDPAGRYPAASIFREAAAHALEEPVRFSSTNLFLGDPAEAAKSASKRRFDRPARFGSGRIRLFHIPEPIGIAWNIVVLAVYSFLVVGSAFAIVYPSSADAASPFWFRAFEYGVAIDLVFGIAAFLLLDRRRLRRMFPGVFKWTVLRETLVGLAVGFAAFILVSAVGSAMGYI